MMLWCDLETDGLDPRKNDILEIGLAVTDDNLDVLTTRAWVLPFVGKVDDFIAKMHGPAAAGGSGLLAECHRAMDVRISSITESIYDWLKANVPPMKEKPPLCGSSVHFDRAFVNESRYAPLLDYVSYRNIDVSTIKELAKRWAPAVYETRPKPGAKHRALLDLDDSIAELKHYRRFFFSGHQD